MKFQDMEFGNIYEFDALLESLNLRHTPQNTSYYAISLSDGETSADGRVWDIHIKEDLEVGNVYHFTAKANDYGNKLQLSVSSIFDCILSSEEEAKFFRSAPLTRCELESKIYSYIEKIDNPILHEITFKTIEGIKEKFFTYPAAVSMHHNFLRGLSYHTYSMLVLADTLICQYPILNKNYVYSGIILHDIGKTKELSKEYNATFTLDGNLLGHVVMSITMVQSVIDSLGYSDAEEAKVLLSLIASHHGKLEYGSPKEPETLDAWAIHLCDLVDSKIAGLSHEVELTNAEVIKSGVGGYTKPFVQLDKKSLYVPYKK